MLYLYQARKTRDQNKSKNIWAMVLNTVGPFVKVTYFPNEVYISGIEKQQHFQGHLGPLS